ncbi:NAD(P)H-hydrate dehydratase [Sphingomonas sp. AP4-R1]|uniref:NAD(P)H-hydrate dehydratase n=1 Tax=Sphingomonas sp. AP4-R1 TaxID=2735134 RepID=UPI001493BA59|nr:NAD(P)H-hydrate dehydratase [Sphingomonas sp. AP4-R1]QJU59723.1 NAD(P)H-hydrate dehydratase [Sphingomonas sp. AP4-R1]
MAEPILTAAETRAAEQMLFDRGIAPVALMERAGKGVADAICAAFPEQAVLVACGPGNNGGDGYVVARLLAERGWPVRVAALADPVTDQAKAMRALWAGPVEAMPAAPAPLVVDALFGIGSRALDPALTAWLDAAEVVVAVDQPSGIETDSGAARGRTKAAALTVALGALKPVHALMPGAGLCGRAEVVELGLPLPEAARLARIGAPALRAPDATSNKYTRGKVVVVAGAMQGAAFLAAEAAQRAGAGYVEVTGDDLPFGTPLSLVRRAWDPEVLADKRIGAIVIGPGLAADSASRARLEVALVTGKPLVLDAGALGLLAQDKGKLGSRVRGNDDSSPLRHSRERGNPAAIRLLTPHAGEFERLFGPVGEDPLAAARKAAAESGALVLLKGATSIVAAPDGRALVGPVASPWLATAGTGDVLAGVCGAMLAQAAWHGFDPLEAVGAAIWLHARAAELAGPAMIADDLLWSLKRAVAKA